MEKGVNKIENQGEIWYKIKQNYQITDFGPIYIMFETKWDRDKQLIFSAERGRKRGSMRSS